MTVAAVIEQIEQLRKGLSAVSEFVTQYPWAPAVWIVVGAVGTLIVFLVGQY